MCLFTVSACSKPENPPTHTHDYNFSTYVIEGEKAYKIKRCECDEYQKEQEIVGAIIATPNTLTDIIKNAGENSTIVLTI